MSFGLGLTLDSVLSLPRPSTSRYTGRGRAVPHLIAHTGRERLISDNDGGRQLFIGPFGVLVGGVRKERLGGSSSRRSIDSREFLPQLVLAALRSPATTTSHSGPRLRPVTLRFTRPFSALRSPWNPCASRRNPTTVRSPAPAACARPSRCSRSPITRRTLSRPFSARCSRPPRAARWWSAATAGIFAPTPSN